MPFKTTLLLASLLIATLLCGQTQKFTITGRVQGFDNGTPIYLNDVSDGNYKKIDSAFISDNKFRFTGNIKTKYLKASLTSFDNNDRVTFWLEKGMTSFVGKKGNFREATIIGSTIQRNWNEYIKIVDTAKNIEQSEYFFIKKNPNSIVAAHNLSNSLKTWSKDSIKVLYKRFTREIKQTKYGERILGFITLNQDIKVGDKFVDFSQKDTSNKIVKLSGFKGKILLLEFWGSWCGPCREENPELIKIYNEFKPKGFDVLGVASETDRTQWIKAIKTDGLIWTNVSDLKGGDNKAALIYGVTGYPTNFLIDKTGKIIAKDVYGEELKNWILKTLK